MFTREQKGTDITALRCTFSWKLCRFNHHWSLDCHCWVGSKLLGCIRDWCPDSLAQF